MHAVAIRLKTFDFIKRPASNIMSEDGSYASTLTTLSSYSTKLLQITGGLLNLPPPLSLDVTLLPIFRGWNRYVPINTDRHFRYRLQLPCTEDMTGVPEWQRCGYSLYRAPVARNLGYIFSSDIRVLCRSYTRSSYAVHAISYGFNADCRHSWSAALGPDCSPSN